jgi:5-methylcytosine-specific restriction endonuclease McrA
MSSTPWERKRRKLKHLLNQQGGLCFYCRKTIRLYVTEGAPIPDDCATVDHKYPRGDWRREDPTVPYKHVAACPPCNNRRGDMPFEDFRTLIANERAQHEREQTHKIYDRRSDVPEMPGHSSGDL